METKNNPALSSTLNQSTVSPIPVKSMINKFKDLPPGKKIILAGAVLLIIFVVLGFIFWQKNSLDSSQAVIVKVGESSIPQRYLDLEHSFYPATSSADLNQKLTQKIIDDEIILQGAKKEGLINSYPGGLRLSSDEYLKRTAEVDNVKNLITQRSRGITVDLVSIWFYNNAPPRIGYEKAREMALAKINTLYERVKNKEITIKQAGEIISTDPELEGMDRAYKENAYVQIKALTGEQMTFWPDFDAKLRSLPLNGLSEIYTASDADIDGKVIPILYTFGQVTEIVNDSNISSFGEWFNRQKETITISYE